MRGFSFVLAPAAAGSVLEFGDAVHRFCCFIPKNETAKTMNSIAKLEHRASSSRSKHEGESSHALCDRLSRTRDNSQRQLPTDQDYAVSTREYQTDQSSLKTAPTAARSVLEQRPKRRQQQTH